MVLAPALALREGFEQAKANVMLLQDALHRAVEERFGDWLYAVREMFPACKACGRPILRSATAAMVGQHTDHDDHSHSVEFLVHMGCTGSEEQIDRLRVEVRPGDDHATGVKP